MRTLLPLLAIASLLCAASAAAQDDPDPSNPVEPLLHGRLVFHGNYCGPGNKGVHPAPVDALDSACMRHDACVKDFQIPTCACNARLAEEATAVASDESAPAEEREAADFTARGAKALPCR